MTVTLGHLWSGEAVATWRDVLVGGADLNQQALVPIRLDGDPGFVTSVGFRARKQGGKAATVQFAVWASDPVTGKPGALLGRTDAVKVGAENVYTKPLVGTCPRLPAGTTVWVGIEAQGKPVSVAEVAGLPAAGAWGTRVPAGNPLGFDGVAYAATAIAASAPVHVWAVVADQAVGPTATAVGPADGAQLSSAPTFAVGYAAPPGLAGAPWDDRMSRYRVEVLKDADGSVVWDQTNAEFAATAAERAANAASRLFTGSLAANTAYRWRAQVADDLGLWSEWTAARTFALTDIGSVDVSGGSPSGKLWLNGALTGAVVGAVGGPNPQHFTGNWSHPSGKTLVAARVYVYAAAAPTAPIRNGKEVAISPAVASGGIVQVPGTAAGVMTADTTGGNLGPLPSGSYLYGIAGKDSSGNWSVVQSLQAFTVNSPPDKPVATLPANGGYIAGDAPTLAWVATDADADDVAGDTLLAAVEFTQKTGAVSTLTTPIGVDATTGWMTLDLTDPAVASLVPAPVATGGETYKWRVRLTDGQSVTGAWSDLWTFVMVPAPRVTVVSPAPGSVVDRATPLFAWTVSNGVQAKWRIRLYRAGGKQAVWSSGERAAGSGSSGSYQMPDAGWVQDGKAYEWDIVVWNASGVASPAVRSGFTVAYPAPAALAWAEATLAANRRDVEPNSVLVSWAQTGYAAGSLVAYAIRRRRADQSEAEAVLVRLVRVAGQGNWTDHHAPPNVDLVYAVSQIVQQAGVGAVESPAVEAEARVAVTVPTLVSLVDGGNVRASVMWLDKGLGGRWEREDEEYRTWGSGGVPTWVQPPQGWGTAARTVEVTVRTDWRGSRAEHFADFEALVRSGHPLCFRGEAERLFCRVASWRFGRGAPGEQKLSLELRQVAWDEAARA